MASQLLAAPNNHLRVLDLSETLIGDLGAIEIASALRDRSCCHLEYLDISDSYITNEGAQALAASLSFNDQAATKRTHKQSVELSETPLLVFE